MYAKACPYLAYSPLLTEPKSFKLLCVFKRRFHGDGYFEYINKNVFGMI